jgi:hypothetical protein
MPNIIQLENGRFEDESHSYFDLAGKEVPGITAMLEAHGFVDLDNIPLKFLKNKRDLGDAVHYGTRIIDETGEDSLNWDTLHDDCTPFVLAYQDFCKDCEFVPEKEWIEKPIIGAINGMPIACTPDRIGRMRGIKHRIVLELKCTSAPHISWKYQTAGQVAMVQAALKTKEHFGRVAVQLKPDATYKPFMYEGPRDIDIVGYALAVTHALINEGLPWRKEKP